MNPRSSAARVFSRPIFSVFGLRPTATSNFSASSASCLPSRVTSVSFTPLPVLSMFSARAPHRHQQLLGFERFLFAVPRHQRQLHAVAGPLDVLRARARLHADLLLAETTDRKSTRLNSS